MSKATEKLKEKAWDKAQEDLFSLYGREDKQGNGYLECSAWDAVHIVVRAYQNVLEKVR